MEVVMTKSPVARRRRRAEEGAATAEYAVVTAAGVGFGGLLIEFLTSDFGQNLLKTLFEFVLSMIGLG
jgi:hypothetical protein